LFLLGILMTDAATSRAHEDASIHVVILRKVREGCGAQFEKQIAAFFKQAANEPGVCGAYLITPIAGSNGNEYGILRSFRSEQDMHAFYQSSLYRRWQEAVAPLVHGDSPKHQLHGMEAFFFAGASPPAKWKMAVLTWLGVNAAVSISSFLFTASRLELPEWISFLVVNALVVAALTWIVMPALVRFLRGWLTPPFSAAETASHISGHIKAKV
jgi:uncharacterized protein